MSLNAFAIVVASALPRAGTVRLQSPPAMSRAAAAMSISGWLVRWLKNNPPASASTKPPTPAKSSEARSSSRNACVGAQSCSSTR